jgi:hypothetical protein
MPNLFEQKWCPKLYTVQSNACGSYGSQEIAVSRTASGHITPDVILMPPGLGIPRSVTISCKYLIIRDFGVDWRHVKLATRNEQLFKYWLNRVETDKSLACRIVGYSDCVGVERNNLFLRRGRALNVFKLLGSSARSRVMAVIAAPPQTFLMDNSTIFRRASNRAVVIELFENSSQTI